MPYIIAIVLVAVAALVFFSRPSTTTNPPEITNENVQPTTEQSTETNTDTTMEVSGETMLDASTGDDGGTADVATEIDTELPSAPDIPISSTLTAETSYLTPARQEHGLTLSVNLNGTTITDASVLYNDGVAKTPQHKAFEANYKSEVIGKDINTISLSRVGGASLTTGAFNEAVVEIRAQI